MRPKILFVHSGNETFVKLDRDLLSVSFEVQDFYVGQKFPVGFVRYWRAIKDANIVYCWFASWNTFWVLLFAKIMHIPSILVIGGYDVANLPIANYGSQRGGLKRWISRCGIKLTDIVLPFSHYSQREAEKNAGASAASLQMIYIGVPDPFGSLPVLPKERMVITVGKVEWSNLKRKGIEPFVYTAVHLPDVQFVVVGAWADDSIEHLRSIASQNVVFTGWVGEAELINYYRHASVYVQASLHEGFGLSVAEAMLGGCIPVVANVGSLPEVVGDCGLYCKADSPKAIAESIRLVLNSSTSERFRAREHILTKFPLEKRRELIEQIINTLMVNNTYV